MNQVNYSIDKEPEICARLIAEAIRAKETEEELARMRKQEEIFGGKIEDIMDQAMRDILGQPVSARWRL